MAQILEKFYYYLDIKISLENILLFLALKVLPMVIQENENLVAIKTSAPSAQ